MNGIILGILLVIFIGVPFLAFMIYKDYRKEREYDLDNTVPSREAERRKIRHHSRHRSRRY